MTTAQDRYKAMLEEHVSPAMRAEGFKGSSGSYVLTSEAEIPRIPAASLTRRKVGPVGFMTLPPGSEYTA